MEILVKNEELAQLANRIHRGWATGDELQKAKLADVLAIKSDDGVMHWRDVYKDVRSTEARARSKAFVASDESVDKMGDVIKVNGWDFSTFKDNPVALWGHNSFAPPIGRVFDIVRGKVGTVPTLFESIEYFEESVNPVSEAIWKMVEAGAVRACSVGFIPTKVKVPDEDEATELKIPSWGVIFQKQKQIELSNCSIGANDNALSLRSVEDTLTRLVKAGEISPSVADAVHKHFSVYETKSVQVPGFTELKSSEEPTENRDVKELQEKYAALEQKHIALVEAVSTLKTQVTALENVFASRNSGGNLPTEDAHADSRAVDPVGFFAKALENVTQAIRQGSAGGN